MSAKIRRAVPSTPLPPAPCLKASITAAMSETPAFSAGPVTPPLPEHTLTPPPTARASIEATDKSDEVLQAEMAELKAEIAALKKSIDSAESDPPHWEYPDMLRTESKIPQLKLDQGERGQVRL